eukprot:IDg6159t1
MRASDSVHFTATIDVGVLPNGAGFFGCECEQSWCWRCSERRAHVLYYASLSLYARTDVCIAAPYGNNATSVSLITPRRRYVCTLKPSNPACTQNLLAAIMLCSFCAPRLQRVREPKLSNPMCYYTPRKKLKTNRPTR